MSKAFGVIAGISFVFYLMLLAYPWVLRPSSMLVLASPERIDRIILDARGRPISCRRGAYVAAGDGAFIARLYEAGADAVLPAFLAGSERRPCEHPK